MNATGKRARKSGGNRYACKARKERRARRRTWDKLPVSASRGNAASFVLEDHTTDLGSRLALGKGRA
jgi:hypothetical protein